MRFNEFKIRLLTSYLNNELDMRNNDKIRYIFTEVITNIFNQIKNLLFEKVKIKKKNLI